MSYKKWVHHCKEHGNKEVELMDKICPECGELGTFNGWGHSVIEMMASYSLRYKLRPIGPHRMMADELFHGRMKKCDQCNGYGLIDSPNGDDRGISCPKCDYGQYVFDGSPQEFESIRQKIISAFPTAEPGSPVPAPVERNPAKKGFEGGGFLKPADDGLQAYKDLVMGLYKAINPNSEEDSSMISDEEWEESWKRATARSKPKE